MSTMRHMDQSLFPLNRRAFLGRYAGAIGTLALAHLLDQEMPRAAGACKRSVIGFCGPEWRMRSQERRPDR